MQVNLTQCDICETVRELKGPGVAAPPRVLFTAPPPPRMSAYELSRQMAEDEVYARSLEEADRCQVHQPQAAQRQESAPAVQNDHALEEDMEDVPAAAASSAAHIAAATSCAAAPAASGKNGEHSALAAQVKPSVKRTRTSSLVRQSHSGSDSNNDVDDDAQRCEESDYSPEDDELQNDPDRGGLSHKRRKKSLAAQRKRGSIPFSSLSKLPFPPPGESKEAAACYAAVRTTKSRAKELATLRRASTGEAAGVLTSRYVATLSHPAMKRAASDNSSKLLRVQSEQKRTNQKKKSLSPAVDLQSEEKPHDWSPLWSLRGEPITSTGLHPTAVSQLFATFVTQSREIENGLAKNVVRSSVHSDSELVVCLELLCNIVRKHHERSALYTLPDYVVEGLWASLLAREVTLHGAQSAYPLLVHLQDLSPCSFLPRSTSFLVWMKEARKLETWLRKRRDMKESGGLEKLVEEARRSVTPNSGAASSDNGSASSSYIQLLQQADQLDAQHRISSNMQAHKDAEIYWAKWCIKTQLIMRALAMDEAARLDGGVDSIRPIPDVPTQEPAGDDAAEAAEVEAAILLTSDPLFLSLILHAPRKHRLEPSSAPMVHDLDTIEEELTACEGANSLDVVRSGKGKKKAPSKKKVTSKQMKAAVAAAAAVAVEESKEHAMDLDDAEADDDAIGADDNFHVFWQELLDYIGLARPSVSNPLAHQQNQLIISTFRSEKCLLIFQETVQRMLQVLANLNRRKIAAAAYASEPE